MKSLDDWLAWQSTLNPRRMELGLERVRQVWLRLGTPNPGFPVITVGGTNGKGSCVALIGFAGPRVIEQTVREKLPEGFQHSEFLLEHGALDMILDRRVMRGRIADVLAILGHRPRPNPPEPLGLEGPVEPEPAAPKASA